MSQVTVSLGQREHCLSHAPVSLRDLNVLHPREFHKRFRSAELRMLECAIGETGCTTFILCAPIDYYLSGLGLAKYPAAGGELHKISSANVGDDLFYKQFLAALRSAGIAKATFPQGLCSSYDQWGAYGSRSLSPFGKKFDSFSWTYRVCSAFVPTRFAAQVREYVRRQLTEFGTLALRRVGEEEDSCAMDRRFSEFPGNSRVPYESRDFEAFLTTVAHSDNEHMQALARVEALIMQAESGLTPAVDLFPLHLIRRAPHLHLNEQSSLIHTTLFERRAKLTQVLMWPWHYTSVVSALAKLNEKVLHFRDERDRLLKSGISHLQEFVSECERRFPVILDNPYADATVTSNFSLERT